MPRRRGSTGEAEEISRNRQVSSGLSLRGRRSRVHYGRNRFAVEAKEITQCQLRIFLPIIPARLV